MVANVVTLLEGVILVGTGPVVTQPKTVLWATSEPKIWQCIPGRIIFGYKSVPINISTGRQSNKFVSAKRRFGKLEASSLLMEIEGRLPEMVGTTSAVISIKIVLSTGDPTYKEHNFHDKIETP